MVLVFSRNAVVYFHSYLWFYVCAAINILQSSATTLLPKTSTLGAGRHRASDLYCGVCLRAHARTLRCYAARRALCLSEEREKGDYRPQPPPVFTWRRAGVYPSRSDLTHRVGHSTLKAKTSRQTDRVLGFCSHRVRSSLEARRRFRLTGRLTFNGCSLCSLAMPYWGMRLVREGCARAPAGMGRHLSGWWV